MVKETFQGQAKQASALPAVLKKISAAQRSKKFPKMTHNDVHVPAATLLVFQFIWRISFIH
jgi:hypothetical protein